MIDTKTSAEIDFNDWLANCPLTWRRDQINEDEVTYTFILPDEEESDS